MYGVVVPPRGAGGAAMAPPDFGRSVKGAFTYDVSFLV